MRSLRPLALFLNQLFTSNPAQAIKDTFTGQSRFFFREYLDVAAGKIEKLMYTYHYQDAANQLLFRYDNAQHKPALLFLEHKHIGDTDIIQADAPVLSEVLLEIAQMREWV